ncbi:MAG: 2-C-methyl-D-erythritol 4-phosphate cytidylyltransferase [Chitinophagaceae bacterium]|nr:2-C-methyl-D-erythritol 4-phosphate cytidylyltransferase [Chitinophagaceae bacterium]
MQTYAVIVAGGSGTRMRAAMPKQFLELAGKPLLVHSVDAFLQAFPEIIVVIVLPQDYLDTGRSLLTQYFPSQAFRFTAGGETRFHSVQQGLAQVDGEGVVFVHDAVRCLVSPALIRRCYEEALRSGSAIPAIEVRDSMRVLTASGHQPINRSLVRAIQTPQTFRSGIIKPAFTQPYRDAFTDEATVVEASGQPVTLVEGEETNIKVTIPLDLVVAEEVLQGRKK